MRLKTCSLTIVLTVLCLLNGANVLLAQSDSARLSGSVVDESEAVVAGVKVVVVNVATAARRETMTDEHGEFTVPILPPAKYRLLTQAKGFASVEISNIVLTAGDQKEIRIKLKVGAVTQMMTINAPAAVVETSSSVGTAVDNVFVQDLPLNGRSFQSLLLMTPGIVRTDGDGQLSVNGQRSDANYFTVDGVSANVGVQINRVLYGSAGGYDSTDQTTSGAVPRLQQLWRHQWHHLG